MYLLFYHENTALLAARLCVLRQANVTTTNRKIINHSPGLIGEWLIDHTIHSLKKPIKKPGQFTLTGFDFDLELEIEVNANARDHGHAWYVSWDTNATPSVTGVNQILFVKQVISV